MPRLICTILACFLRVFFSLLFFFSSRRRHTRWPRDWSSDVCSSDLTIAGLVTGLQRKMTKNGNPWAIATVEDRSEERRVGKECRARGAAGEERKKEGRERREGQRGEGDRRKVRAGASRSNSGVRRVA